MKIKRILHIHLPPVDDNGFFSAEDFPRYRLLNSQGVYDSLGDNLTLLGIESEPMSNKTICELAKLSAPDVIMLGYNGCFNQFSHLEKLKTRLLEKVRGVVVIYGGSLPACQWDYAMKENLVIDFVNGKKSNKNCNFL